MPNPSVLHRMLLHLHKTTPFNYQFNQQTTNMRQKKKHQCQHLLDFCHTKMAFLFSWNFLFQHNLLNIMQQKHELLNFTYKNWLNMKQKKHIQYQHIQQQPISTKKKKTRNKKLSYEKLTVMKTRALITRGREVLGLTKSLKSLLRRKGRSRILWVIGALDCWPKTRL
jgi:hypothetical protein